LFKRVVMYIPTASEDSGRFDCKHQKIKSNGKIPAMVLHRVYAAHGLHRSSGIR